LETNRVVAADQRGDAVQSLIFTPGEQQKTSESPG
jgi:hypothetical protein